MKNQKQRLLDRQFRLNSGARMRIYSEILSSGRELHCVDEREKRDGSCERYKPSRRFFLILTLYFHTFNHSRICIYNDSA